MFTKIKDQIKLKNTKKISFFESRLCSTTNEDLQTEIDVFLKKGFKADTHIEVKDLFEIKYQLFLLLQFYEFYRIQGSIETNSISMDNFAKVFISYINIYQNRTIAERISKKEIKLSNDKISFNEFISFFWLVSEFSQVKNKLKEESITKKDLITFANKIVDTLPDKTKKVKLSEKHINLLFDILDTDSKYFYNLLILLAFKYLK
jgi:hypothetical protein